MGSYYVTVQRPGEFGEYKKEGGVETGVYSSPNELFLAFSQKKVGVHARIKMRLPAHKKLKGEGEKEFTPGHGRHHDHRPGDLQRHPPPKMPFYNMALGQKQLQMIIADCYQILGRAETIALLDNMKDLGFPRVDPLGPLVRHRRPQDAGLERPDPDGDREGGRQGGQALPARDHHRAGAVQQGPRLLDPRPRTDHHRDDGAVAERRPQRRGLPQPDLPHGRLGCPRWRRADPPACRDARPDGQALGQDHRDADQGQLPRRPERARVLLLDPRGS